jgi:phage antirepressor YoqD-like protein
MSELSTTKVEKMNELTISGVSIRQDEQGRFCLNDLHKAAGEEKRHQPSDWLRVQQTQELIKEVEIPGIPGIVSKQGLGTFAVKELVYAYAMWISPKFHLQVILAYDSNQKAVLPDFSNQAAAARAWADEVEQKMAALEFIEANRHKVEFADFVSRDSNTRCIRIWVKAMKHENNLTVGVRDVFAWLVENKYIYRQGKVYLPYARYEADNLNYFSIVVFDDDKGKPRRQLTITGNGVIALTGKVLAAFANETPEYNSPLIPSTAPDCVAA